MHLFWSIPGGELRVAVPLRRCSSQNGSGYTPALTATASTYGGRRVGHCGKSKRAEFWIVTACFCTPSTSSHINHRPSPPSRSLGGGFPLPSNSHAPSNTHTAVYAHTQQDPEVRLPHCPCTHEVDVSSDYQHCSLLASGASILDLFFFFFVLSSLCGRTNSLWAFKFQFQNWTHRKTSLSPLFTQSKQSKVSS